MYVHPQTLTGILQSRDLDNDTIDKIIVDYNLDSSAAAKIGWRIKLVPKEIPKKKEEDILESHQYYQHQQQQQQLQEEQQQQQHQRQQTRRRNPPETQFESKFQIPDFGLGIAKNSYTPQEIPVNETNRRQSTRFREQTGGGNKGRVPDSVTHPFSQLANKKRSNPFQIKLDNIDIGLNTEEKKNSKK